jgi:hypothetical protein
MNVPQKGREGDLIVLVNMKQKATHLENGRVQEQILPSFFFY